MSRLLRSLHSLGGTWRRSVLRPRDVATAAGSRGGERDKPSATAFSFVETRSARRRKPPSAVSRASLSATGAIAADPDPPFVAATRAASLSVKEVMYVAHGRLSLARATIMDVARSSVALIEMTAGVARIAAWISGGYASLT